MIDLLERPLEVLVLTEGWNKAQPEGDGYTWNTVHITYREGELALTAQEPVKAVTLRWKGTFAPNTRVLGDDWERAYGKLGFVSLRNERPLPWYFLATDEATTDGYGVKTGPNAFCMFYASSDGIDLVADVRSGGVGVELGGRTFLVCTVVCREGKEGESAFAAGRAFCKQMCDAPRKTKQPVYGSNNWYYAMGNITHDSVLADADLIAELTAGLENRPFMVIDDGWQVKHQSGWGGYNGGPWDQGNEDFPDMAGLAAGIRERGCIPGIWFRPLHFREENLKHLTLSRAGDILDPSRPETLEQVYNDVKRIVDWGYGLIKHDFSTVDILGKFGGWIDGGRVTDSGWAFADRSRTSCEIILDFYRTIRAAAGEDTVIIGCNTLSHLSAGIFELQRTGDDTSGTDWERTRFMGVNTAAFRAIQHDAFYACDADCIGITGQIDWSMNRQWLELLAKSGTPLFVSPDPKAMTPQILHDLRKACEIASQPQRLGEPLDWLYNDSPATWRFGEEITTFRWREEGTAPWKE